MQIRAIKVQRLYLQVADQLRELIDSGVFVEGGRLPAERELAVQFEVSRPTIREAMIALEISGIVEVRSGSGVYVLKPTNGGPREVDRDRGPGPFEILEARRLFEGEACALAAQRISDAQLDRLAELLEEMEQENLRETVTEQADEKFHKVIADAAGNSAISATIEWLWQLRNDSEISTHFHQRVRREGVRPITAEHRHILNALQQRNPDDARRAMVSHLQRVTDQLLKSQ